MTGAYLSRLIGIWPCFERIKLPPVCELSPNGLIRWDDRKRYGLLQQLPPSCWANALLTVSLYCTVLYCTVLYCTVLRCRWTCHPSVLAAPLTTPSPSLTSRPPSSSPSSGGWRALSSSQGRTSPSGWGGWSDTSTVWGTCSAGDRDGVERLNLSVTELKMIN